jgi:hypothetical protein
MMKFRSSSLSFSGWPIGRRRNAVTLGNPSRALRKRRWQNIFSGYRFKVFAALISDDEGFDWISGACSDVFGQDLAKRFYRIASADSKFGASVPSE